MASFKNPTITIQLGARIWIERPDGSYESYIFRGGDDRGLVFEDDSGAKHYDVLGRPYSKLGIQKLPDRLI